MQVDQRKVVQAQPPAAGNAVKLPGAACGKAVFDADTAADRGRHGKADVLQAVGQQRAAVGIEVDEHGTPVERVSFAFTQVEVEYRRQESSGQAGASNTFMDEFLPQ